VVDSDHQHQTPSLDAVYADLADSIESWASTLGTETTYTDPVLEESGSKEWAASLRKCCDWALRTAGSLLAVRGHVNQADDLKRRMVELFDAAEGYEQRLDAMEDQCRVRIERITSQYRRAIGDDDPDAIRLGRLCQGTGRVWTLTLDDRPPETPEQFAEAIDRALLEEEGAKGRAKAEMQRQAGDVVEHLRLLVGIESDSNRHQPSQAADDDAPTADSLVVPVDDEQFGGPQRDPVDNRLAWWMGKRIYLGDDTQISRLFWLLASPLGQRRAMAEVQRAIDHMETSDFVNSSAEDIRKSQQRVRKAISILRQRLVESELDKHVLITKGGTQIDPDYTMVSRFGS